MDQQELNLHRQNLSMLDPGGVILQQINLHGLLSQQELNPHRLYQQELNAAKDLDLHRLNQQELSLEHPWA